MTADAPRGRLCSHVYCKHKVSRELESAGQPLESDRIWSERRFVVCRL